MADFSITIIIVAIAVYAYKVTNNICWAKNSFLMHLAWASLHNTANVS